MQTDQRDRLTAALAGRYVIERELGSGGMATVYLAHDGEPMADGSATAVESRAAAGWRPTPPGRGVGTAACMGPERAVRGRGWAARSAVYSLGCGLYEMLASEPPYTAATAQLLIANR